ncbi:MAG: hypothetical protein ABR599_11780 [Gemmatimonadota bacterium]
MTRVGRVSAVLALLAALALPAAAQERPGADRAPRADTLRGSPQLPAGLARRLDELRRRRLAEYLQLDSAGLEDLERELRAFRERQEELRRDRLRLLAELREDVGAGGPLEGALPAARREVLQHRLDALRHNAQERQRALEDLRRDLSRDLTLEQQARLHLFAERFQRRLEEGARRIRERRATGRPRADAR